MNDKENWLEKDNRRHLKTTLEGIRGLFWPEKRQSSVQGSGLSGSILLPLFYRMEEEDAELGGSDKTG